MSRAITRTEQLKNAATMYLAFKSDTDTTASMTRFNKMFATANGAIQLLSDGSSTFDRSKARMSTPPNKLDEQLMAQFEAWIEKGDGSKIRLLHPAGPQPMDVTRVVAAAVQAPAMGDPLTAALEKIKQLEEERTRENHRKAELAAEGKEAAVNQAEVLKEVLAQATADAVAKITAAAAAISLSSKTAAEEEAKKQEAAKHASKVEKEEAAAAVKEMHDSIQKETLAALASIAAAKVTVPVDAVAPPPLEGAKVTVPVDAVAQPPLKDASCLVVQGNRKKRSREGNPDEDNVSAWGIAHRMCSGIVGVSATNAILAFIALPAENDKKTGKKDD